MEIGILNEYHRRGTILLVAGMMKQSSMGQAED